MSNETIKTHNIYSILTNEIGLDDIVTYVRTHDTDILKVDFLRGQNFSFEILRKKKCKNITKNHLICVKHEEKNCKRG